MIFFQTNFDYYCYFCYGYYYYFDDEIQIDLPADYFELATHPILLLPFPFEFQRLEFLTRVFPPQISVRPFFQFLASQLRVRSKMIFSRRRAQTDFLAHINAASD